MAQVELYHLYDHLGKRIAHEEGFFIPMIPAVVELCIQSSVDLLEYPTKRRRKPIIRTGRSEFIDADELDLPGPTQEPPRPPILAEVLDAEVSPPSGKEEVVLLSEETLRAWETMRGGAKRLMKVYPVRVCGHSSEVHMVPAGTRHSVLKACGGLGCHDAVYGRSVHGRVIKTGFLSDVVVASSVVGMYAKGGNFGSATDEAGEWDKELELFEKMKESGYKLNSVSYTAAISSCVRLLHLDRERRSMRSWQMTGLPLMGSLPLLLWTSALDIGREVHKSIVAQKLDSSEIVMGALLDMHAKCGALNEALEVFHHLPWRDIVLWTSMLVAYGSHGQAVEALRLLMKCSNSVMLNQTKSHSLQWFQLAATRD
ncbi:unnamed protein product [Cuscuta campestris]|uniref:APO domain-containing protein n=1 Tax=Cuscuta campestris TaxID=132261 RepID=A0A484NPT5_9ASTE|nr:unnamed protein product [Cuscuta campestris]